MCFETEALAVHSTTAEVIARHLTNILVPVRESAKVEDVGTQSNLYESHLFVIAAEVSRRLLA
jgi:hypothetical protein